MKNDRRSTIDERQIKEEEKKMDRLTGIVDKTSVMLKVLPMSDEVAEKLIEETKAKVLELFPDKEEVFELIYRPRYYRILQSRRTKH